MKQFLVIIRGAPASGKTTIAKRLRNFGKKVAWLKVDNFKDFFSDESPLEEQKYVDECALATLKYLLKGGFSVVMEKIFFSTYIIPLAIEVAKKRDATVKIFQIKCPLSVLQDRDKNRPGVKEGCRKPLGDETIEKLYNRLEDSFYPGAIILDTEKYSIEECTRIIMESVASQ